MKKLALIYTLVVSLFFIGACKPKEKVEPTTGILVNVVDENNSKVVGADVYLFENETDFKTFRGNPSLVNLAVGQGKTNEEGQIRFCDLKSDPQVNYHFYVVKDGITNVDVNDAGQYAMNLQLIKSAIHVVTIPLKASFRKEIIFYSNDANVVGNTISIEMLDASNKLVPLSGTISQVYNSGTQTGGLVYTPTATGTFKFLVKNQNGCVWVKEVTFGENETKKEVELEACGEAAYTFRSTTLSASENIKVYLNNETKEAGTITSTNNSFTSYRPNGTYTFKAVHSNKTCVWIDEIDGGETKNFNDCGN